MANDVSCTVEFIGGPFDGRVEQFSAADDHPPPKVARGVSDKAIRSSTRECQVANGCVTSVAHYALEWRRGAWRYRFISAVSPESLGLRQAASARRVWSILRSLFQT
jgi:hypothetical protein